MRRTSGGGRAVRAWIGMAVAGLVGACAAEVGGGAIGEGGDGVGESNLQQTLTFTGSVSASGTSWIAHSIAVSQPSTIDATLDWGNASANLNLFLRDPSVTGVAQATTSARPEHIRFDATTTGQWSLGVKAKSGSSSYTLTVRVTSLAPSVKPPCRGLMTRRGAFSTLDFVDANVVHVLWSDLEPSDQSFTGPGWATIDNAIATGHALRLRVMAGIQAPDFVKRLGHAPVSGSGIDCSRSGGIAIYNPYDKTGGCAPFFWQSVVLDQYEQLMTEIARRYESTPEVREVVDSGCMTVYAEPFYRAHRDLASNQRLWNAGLNATTDLACHRRAMAIHARVFQRTRTSIAMNPWDIIDASATDYRRIDWSATRSFIDESRALMGGRLVLQNNGLGEADECPAGKTPETNSYCYLGAAAGPVGFQTETWPRLGDSGMTSAQGLYAAIENGLGMGATFIELPSGFEQADMSRLRAYDADLEAMPCCGAPVF